MGKEKSLYEQLQESTKEKRVEHVYWEYIPKTLKKMKYPAEMPDAEGLTDGILKTGYYNHGVKMDYSILLEFKNTKDFKNSEKKAEVILQAICYLKEHKSTRQRGLPRVVFIGNKYSCFILPVSILLPYISREIVGYHSASTAYSNEENKKILEDIQEDREINNAGKLYEIKDDSFTLEPILTKCIEYAKNEVCKVKIVEDIIEEVFKDFDENICNKKSGERWDGRITKDLFMGMVLNNSHYDESLGKVGFRVGVDENGSPKNNYRSVNKIEYFAFKDFYKFEYTEKEKRKFSEICDRLIEENDRRKKGDFYTPSILAKKSHEYLKKYLGDDFPKNYVVWDCCCGTMNLTRDLGFNHLYSSTLEQGDIDICKSRQYNNDEKNRQFVYDFLNEDTDKLYALIEKKYKEGKEITSEDFKDWFLFSELTGKGLIDAWLSGKKCLIYINPPYGTACAFGHAGKTNYKSCIAKDTKMAKIMKKDDVGKCRENLYPQFLYKIYLLQKLFDKSEFHIGVFSPLGYLTLQSFEKFREKFMGQFGLLGGCLFAGNEFPNVKGNWPITFTVWQKDKSSVDYLDVVEKELGNYVSHKERHFYSVNKKESCSEWCNTEIKGKGKDYPNFSSGLKYLSKKSRGTLMDNALGYYYNISNIVGTNNQGVYIASACASGSNGISIMEDNFERVVSNFAARRLITGKRASWVNYFDEYMIPNENDSKYNEWLADAVIYSLFNSKSNQTALRDIVYNSIDYPDKHKWDIHNEFFFMSREEIKNLAEEYCYNEIERDLYNPDDIKERYVYKWLEDHKSSISIEGKAVLDKAKELIRKTFKYRQEFNRDFMKDVGNDSMAYHLNAWDAGWYQLKDMIEKYETQGLKDFNELYSQLDNKMYKQVFKLGFLKENNEI